MHNPMDITQVVSTIRVEGVSQTGESLPVFCVSHHHDGCPWRLVIDVELRQVLLVILIILHNLCLVIALGTMFFYIDKVPKNSNKIFFLFETFLF
jgi:hypothetical protein